MQTRNSLCEMCALVDRKRIAFAQNHNVEMTTKGRGQRVGRRKLYTYPFVLYINLRHVERSSPVHKGQSHNHHRCANSFNTKNVCLLAFRTLVGIHVYVKQECVRNEERVFLVGDYGKETVKVYC